MSSGKLCNDRNFFFLSRSYSAWMKTQQKHSILTTCQCFHFHKTFANLIQLLIEQCSVQTSEKQKYNNTPLKQLKHHLPQIIQRISYHLRSAVKQLQQQHILIQHEYLQCTFAPIMGRQHCWHRINSFFTYKM